MIFNSLSQSNNYAELEISVNAETDAEYSKDASVIIPYYRGKDILEKTLTGLRLQTYPSDLFEVIIADESHDGVEDLVRNFRQYYEIRFVKQNHRGFQVATLRNKAIRNARNEVIVQLDFDMLPLAEFIEAHMRWFHFSDRVATIGPRRFVDTSNIDSNDILADIKIAESLPDIYSISNTGGGKTDKRIPEFQFFKTHPFPSNCFHGCNVAYRKQDACDVGLYDEEFDFNFGYEDIEFGTRLWKKGLYLVFEPNALALHQENNVVTYTEKLTGRKANRVLLYKKAPGIAEFRESFGKSRRW